MPSARRDEGRFPPNRGRHLPNDSETSVVLIAMESCFGSAVIGVADALSLANYWCAAAGHPHRFSIAIATTTGEPVHGFSGISLESHLQLDPTQRPDVVVIPPLVGDVLSALGRDAALVEWLRGVASRGAVVASVCTGAFYLAEAGLLDGRHATTNPAFAALFSQRYPQVQLTPERRLTEDNEFLCAGSTTAFLQLALRLVDRYCGHEVAVLSGKALNIGTHIESQLPYSLFRSQNSHDDEGIRQLQEWIEGHFADNISTNQLAKVSGMSLRTLNRRFKAATGAGPLEYVQSVRIEMAKRQLDSSAKNVESIAIDCGYKDARSFSRLFRARTDVSPSAYRSRFGVAG